MSARRLLTAVVATAAMLSALPAQASAVPREFFGTISFTPTTGAEFETLGRGNVGTMRTLLNWYAVEPSQGARNWGSYDAFVESAALNGIRVFPTIYGSPPFAARSTNQPPSPGARGAFAAFVGDAVARYGANGTFWQQFALEHPGVAPMPFTDWQLWNEANSPTFWSRKPTAKQYVKLLKATSSAIKSRDPSARVVLAGLFTRPHQKRAVPLIEYLTDLYQVPKSKKFFDAVAVHPYAGTPKQALRTVKAVRKLMKSSGDGRTPIWVTEIGWASSGPKTRFTTSPQGQASNLEQSLSQLAGSAGKLGIRGVIWYSHDDAPGCDYWIYCAGLFDESGAPKPSWFSFVKLTGGSP
jgi:hypothetical protein